MFKKYVLANHVTEQEFEKTVYQWLSEGDYTPDDIIENIITQNNYVHIPLYYAKGEYTGQCSASLGYQRLEYYYEWNAYEKRQERRSRTVTDWHPYSSPVQGNAEIVCYAGEPLQQEIIDFVEGMGWSGKDMQEISSIIDQYEEINGLFKVTKDQSWDNKGGKKAYAEALRQTIQKLPSSIYMNLALDVKFNESVAYGLAAPYWLFSYEYAGGKYFVMVDGTSAKRIRGTRPEDKKRKAEVNKIQLFGWFVGLLGITVALYFFAGQSFSAIKFSWKNAGIVAAGLILTGILVGTEVGKIKNKSKRARNKKLSEKLSKL